MRASIIFVLAMVLSGCSILTILPAMVYDSTITASCDSCMGDVGKYRVASKGYPSFTINSKLPSPDKYYMGVVSGNDFRFESKIIFAGTPDILMSDVWQVKYDLGEFLIIQSESYTQRYLDIGINGDEEMWVQKASELGIVISKTGKIISNLVATQFRAWGYMAGGEQKIIAFERANFNNQWPEKFHFTTIGS
jgi:hypothetical protein